MKATPHPFAWQSKAKCRNSSTSIFFDDEDGSNHSRDRYKAICNSCPVRPNCLETAIIYNFDGVWGGLEARERRELYSKEYREQLVEELDEIGDYVHLDHNAA
jgi:hypothetical protein